MNFLESNKKVFLILFSIYFIVNIPFLLNYNGIYWDDWVIVDQDLETLNAMFTQAVGYAGYVISYLHYFMINYLGVFSYRVLTFLLLFFSGWFVYKILSDLSIFSSKDRFFLTIFFLVAPLYNAKVALINFPYTLCTFIFFLSFYFLSKYYKDLKILKRILILALFFFSFLANSILVFYTVVLIYLFYVNYSLDKSVVRNNINFIKNNIDFILLPIVFYIVKSIWFKPYGLYEGYNKIEFNNILNIDNYINILNFNIIDPVMESIYLLNLLNISIIFFLCVFLFNNIKFDKKINQYMYLLIVGIVVLLLAAFPYIIVGKIPSSMEQDSRFQVLLFLGFSIIFYYIIILLFNVIRFEKNFSLMFVLILSIYSFSLNSFQYQIKYNWEWIYQQSIIENFLSSDEVINNSTFVVIDNVLYKNFIRLGEAQMNGISKKAFNSSNKLFIYRNLSLLEYFKKICIESKEFNCSNWVEKQPINISIINNKKIDIFHNISYLLKLKYLEVVDNKQFKKEIKDLVILEFK